MRVAKVVHTKVDMWDGHLDYIVMFPTSFDTILEINFLIEVQVGVFSNRVAILGGSPPYFVPTIGVTSARKYESWEATISTQHVQKGLKVGNFFFLLYVQVCR